MRVELTPTTSSGTPTSPCITVDRCHLLCRARAEELIKHLQTEMNLLWPKEKNNA